MSAVDLTKCQPGDLLKMRNGDTAVYCGNDGGKWMQHIFCPVDCGHTEFAHDYGSANDRNEDETDLDVVAIIHPTRAELEGQRRELLEALVECAGDLACYEIDAAKYPAKMQTLARVRKAISSVKAPHG